MNHLRNIGRGQASLMAVIIAATTTILGSALTAWATASESIAAVDNRVTAVTITEDLHYKEVKETLERMEKKLDSIPSVRAAALLSQ